MNDSYYINLEENYLDDQMRWEIRCEQALDTAHDCLFDIISDMRVDMRHLNAKFAFVSFGNNDLEYCIEEEVEFSEEFVNKAVEYLTEEWDERDLEVEITYHDDNYNLL